MEELLAFAATVILISMSGVMSPGPLFAANVFYGLKEGAKAGLKMACGHTVVELPLVIFLGIGIISLESYPEFRILITILGALGLFAFAGLQIKSIITMKANSKFDSKHGAFFAGIIFSALNPFFIIWWFTIGFKLISDSMELWSFSGIAIMFLLHIWMDFAWLTGISFVTSKSKNLLTNRNYKFLLIAISGVLIYYGFTFLFEITI